MELGAVNVSANELRRMVRSSMKAVLILCTKTELVTRQTAEGETLPGHKTGHGEIALINELGRISYALTGGSGGGGGGGGGGYFSISLAGTIW